MSEQQHIDVVRVAVRRDTDRICRFGAAVVEPHYSPLIGVAAAADQVRTWWNAEHIGAAVAEGHVVVAESGGDVVGVGQRGDLDGVPVVWKLYVAPDQRGHGLGRQLLAALEAGLPADVRHVVLEHFAANERAAAFYEREGFTVQRVEPAPDDDPRRAVVWRSRSRP